MVRRKRKNNILAWILSPFFQNSRDSRAPDMVLLSMVGLLIFFGLLFLSSASSDMAFFRYEGDTYRFVKQQILHGVLPGLLLFYITLRINYRFYRKFTYLFLILSLAFLGLVFIGNFEAGFGTAQSWISIGGLVFQPSELVKLFLILFLAGWFDIKKSDVKSLSTTTIPFVVILGIISAMIIAQPDIGTLSIIAFISLAMFFVSGAKLTHLGVMILGATVAFLAMIKAAPYRLNRISAWLDPNLDPQGIGWQIKQALIAIGSGGLFGVGLGSSKQVSYLPQPANDSIFAVISEEVGFVFTVGFLILFAILMYRGFAIARQSDDNYAKLIALGITIWVSLQVFINIAGLIRLMPLTGVPLPFISLGGTNLVVTLIAMGILANISRYAKAK